MADLQKYTVKISANRFTGVLRAETSWGHAWEISSRLIAEQERVKQFTQTVNQLAETNYTPQELMARLEKEGSFTIQVDPRKVIFRE